MGSVKSITNQIKIVGPVHTAFKSCVASRFKASDGFRAAPDLLHVTLLLLQRPPVLILSLHNLHFHFPPV